MTTTKQLYKHFIRESAFPWCWLCGRDRTYFHKPVDWYGTWMLERSHIVSSPRVEDARVIVIMCSRCHGIKHGSRFVLRDQPAEMPEITVAHLLWLKLHFDPANYDRSFLQRYSVSRLPRAMEPPEVYRSEYVRRRGKYIASLPR